MTYPVYIDNKRGIAGTDRALFIQSEQGILYRTADTMLN